MSKRLSINVSLNILGTVFGALVGFVTLPFLVRQLGSETYGLWTLITATTGIFAALDLGVAASVQRMIAGKRASDDIAEINAVMSTAFAFLIVVAVAVLCANIIAMQGFSLLFHVPAAQAHDVQVTLLILGISVALSLPGSIFSALLCSYERFDLDTMSDVFSLCLRTGLTLGLVRQNTSLAEVAVIVITATVAGTITTAGLSWYVEPRLRLARRLIRIAIFREIHSFGLWYFALVMGRSLVPQIAPSLIGVFLGNASVTTYAIARQLVVYSSLIVSTAARTVAPKAAAFHFSNRHGNLAKLFIQGSRLSLAFSLFIAGGLIFLGAPFLTLWQGGSHNQSFVPLVILVLGELVPMSQSITFFLLASIGKHRRLAIFILLEGLMNISLTLIVALTSGLIWICVATSLSALLFRGILQMQYGCRELGVPKILYARAILPVAILGSTVIALAGLSSFVWTPHSIITFLLSGTVYSGIMGAGMLPVFFRGLKFVVRKRQFNLTLRSFSFSSGRL